MAYRGQYLILRAFQGISLTVVGDRWSGASVVVAAEQSAATLAGTARLVD
jgi:hypothetical protein